jgi:renal tumor antigen
VDKLPEVMNLRALQGHPNLITLIDVMYDAVNGNVALVFELMDVNLYELLKRNKGPLTESAALLLIYQMLKGVAYIHSKNMFHRDLKPENCMMNLDTNELKIVDFGSVRLRNGALPYTEYVSTRWYRAPECILTSGSYGKEVDIWAIGCMLYELVTDKPLFPGKHELDQISRIHDVLGTPSKELLQEFRKNPNTQIAYSFPPRRAIDLHGLLPRASDDLVDLLEQLLTYDPRNRISAAQALQHRIFTQLRETDQKWESRNKGNLSFPVFYSSRPKVETPESDSEEPVVFPVAPPSHQPKVYHFDGPDPRALLEHKKRTHVPGQFYKAVITLYRPQPPPIPPSKEEVNSAERAIRVKPPSVERPKVYHFDGPDPRVLLEHRKRTQAPGQFYKAVIKLYRPGPPLRRN